MPIQPLHLRILDMDRLPDNGPLEVVLDGSTPLTLGRDAGADWALPDARRFISGRHLEFRHENGAWWMHDVSTNGTFVNGAKTRVQSPYRLVSGDRLQIGHYTMAVTVVGDLGVGDGAWDDDATVVSTLTSQIPRPDAAPPGPVSDPVADPVASVPPVTGQEPIPDSWLDDLDLPLAPPADGDADKSAAAQEMPIPDVDLLSDPGSIPPGASPPDQLTIRPGVDLASDVGNDTPASPAFEAPLPPSEASETARRPSDPPAPEPIADAQASPFVPDAPALPDDPVAPEWPARDPSVSANPFAAPVSDPVSDSGSGLTAADPEAPNAFEPAPASSPPVTPPDTSAPPVTSTPPVTPSGQERTLPPDAVLAAICKAAGLPSGTLTTGNQTATATEIGRALKLMAEELTALLQARAVERQNVTGEEMTMIGRGDNNPLKFMPTAEQALNIMFGPPRQGFQRGNDAVRTSFDDIRHHQKATAAAVAPALSRLLTELSPETIEAGTDRSGLLANPKARAWETFVEQWNAKTASHEDGMVDVFMGYFSDAYDAQGKAP